MKTCYNRNVSYQIKGDDGMPAVIELKKERIVQVAVKMVNAKGWEAVNARSLAKELGVSTKPLYRIYKSMDEIKKDIYNQL